jgi:hypothetical protein
MVDGSGASGENSGKVAVVIGSGYRGKNWCVILSRRLYSEAPH